MRFSLIAAPLELGCGTTGCAMGGAALIGGENGLLSFLTHNGISASADSAFVPMTARREGEPAPHYLQEVVTACCATRDAVSLAQGEGTFPLTLGGDHALGLGTVAGTAQHYSPEELSLVWVDAHTDINTEKSSTSGNIHGMPIAALLGLCGPELTAVCGGAAVLRPENVAAVKETGLLIHLDTPFYRILKNLSYSNSRPLLNRPDKQAETRRLYNARKAIYHRVSDTSVRSPKLSDMTL